MNAKLVSKVPITPNNVDCIVFWTKDAGPILEYLDEIDTMGYKYYFQFTVTPYENDIELNVRKKSDIISTFITLSKKIGKEKVIFRYDPILITDNDKYTYEYHLKAFKRLCEHFRNHTERVVISFIDGYKKVSKSMNNIGIRELTEKEMHGIADEFSKITKYYNLRLETCAEGIDLDTYGIKHSKCIDGELIERVIGSKLKNTDKLGKSRSLCGCMKSIDIGQYDTCVHGCIYCYANRNKDLAAKNFKQHYLDSPLLLRKIDSLPENYQIKERKEDDTKSFREPLNIECYTELDD